MDGRKKEKRTKNKLIDHALHLMHSFAVGQMSHTWREMPSSRRRWTTRLPGWRQGQLLHLQNVSLFSVSSSWGFDAWWMWFFFFLPSFLLFGRVFFVAAMFFQPLNDGGYKCLTSVCLLLRAPPLKLKSVLGFVEQVLLSVCTHSL